MTERTAPANHHGGPVVILQAKQSKRYRQLKSKEPFKHGPVISVVKNGAIENRKRYSRYMLDHPEATVTRDRVPARGPETTARRVGFDTAAPPLIWDVPLLTTCPPQDRTEHCDSAMGADQGGRHR